MHQLQQEDGQPIGLTADEMRAIDSSAPERLALLERATAATIQTGRQLMEALAASQRAVLELRVEFDAHLLDAAPLKEALTANTRRIALLEEKVDGQGGLVAGMAAVNARTELHTQMLKSLESGNERIVDILHGKAGIPGLVLRQHTDATRNETIGRVALVLLTSIGTAASVLAVYEPIVKWIAKFR